MVGDYELLDESLECPTCKGELSRHIFQNDAERTYGLLKCSCSTYPIVENVHVLRDDALTKLAAERIRERAFDDALSLLLEQSDEFLPSDSFFRSLLRKGTNHRHPVARAAALPLLASQSLESAFGDDTRIDSFPEAVDALLDSADPEVHFDEYVLYRPIDQSFWNLHALLPLVDGGEGPVLDYGGGAGHASQLIARATSRPVYNVDIDLRVLYLYSRFINPGAPSIALQEGRDLPFENDAFETTINIDGLQYVSNAYSVSGELERVTAANGTILLLHQHTRREHPNSGRVLPAEGYERGFSRDGVVVPERELLETFLELDESMRAPIPRLRYTATRIRCCRGTAPSQ